MIRNLKVRSKILLAVAMVALVAVGVVSSAANGLVSLSADLDRLVGQFTY
jgi:hypothetical protein